MPVYTYRREDGTTFDYRQKFTDDALTVDPDTGQHVTRVIQPAGVIFKGSGFYVNDSKSASHSAIGTPKSEKSDSADKTEKADKPASEKSESGNGNGNGNGKSEKAEKAETVASKPAESAPKAAAPAAAD